MRDNSKDRNQGNTGWNNSMVSQDFRPLAPLGACPWFEQGVTMERPCFNPSFAIP